MRRGFTLIELLITIVVIAILIALLLPAIGSARRSVIDAQVRTDIAHISNAISAQYGDDMPGRIVLHEDASLWFPSPGDPGYRETVRAKSLIRRIWPQFDFRYQGSHAYKQSNQHDINRDGNITTLKLTGAECLAFFLGGTLEGSGPQKTPNGFSKNPRDPFAPGGSRDGPFIEFQGSFNPQDKKGVGRLTDVDQDGVPEYMDPISSQQTPYLYLTSYDGQGYELDDLNVFGDGSPLNMSDVYKRPDGTPFKPKSYQIVSPGNDGKYGVGGIYDPSTSATNLGGSRSVERDNITNFESGRLGN